MFTYFYGITEGCSTMPNGVVGRGYIKNACTRKITNEQISAAKLRRPKSLEEYGALIEMSASHRAANRNIATGENKTVADNIEYVALSFEPTVRKKIKELLAGLAGTDDYED